MNFSPPESTWDEVSPQIDRAVEELPDELRVPVILHFLQGRGQTEIAKELELNQSTISRRIEKGVGELREKLSDGGLILSVTGLSALLVDHAVIAAPASLLVSLRKIALAGVCGRWAARGP